MRLTFVPDMDLNSLSIVFKLTGEWFVGKLVQDLRYSLGGFGKHWMDWNPWSESDAILELLVSMNN